MDKIWKIIDVIEWGKGFFTSKGIDSPRLNIELIICHVLQIERIKLYTSFDYPLKSEELSEMKIMILRRSKREPLQYIIGKTSFIGLDIEVNPDVLIPRPETEELVEKVMKNIDIHSELNILDIGTGSGCIAIALAKFLPASHITAIDISDSALNTAKRNAIMNEVKNISFEKKDFLTNCNFLNGFDVLVSNPPYISQKEFEESCETEIKFEPRFALTDEGDGLIFYRKFADEFIRILNPGGKFYFETAYNQSSEISELFRENYVLKIHKDFSGIDRIIEGNVKIV